MKICPSCRLINPAEAEICDCGYNFATKLSIKETAKTKVGNEYLIIPIIFTAIFAIVVGCLFCVYNGVGFFIYYWYVFRGVVGVFFLWFIAIVLIIITLIPVIISWIVFLKLKNKNKHH